MFLPRLELERRKNSSLSVTTLKDVRERKTRLHIRYDDSTSCHELASRDGAADGQNGADTVRRRSEDDNRGPEFCVSFSENVTWLS